MLFEWILAAWVDDYSGDEGRRLAGEGDQTLALAAGLECTRGVHPRRSFIEDLGGGLPAQVRRWAHHLAWLGQTETSECPVDLGPS